MWLPFQDEGDARRISLKEGADIEGFQHLLSNPWSIPMLKNVEEQGHVGDDASTTTQSKKSCHVLIGNIPSPFVKVFSFAHYIVLMIVS